MDRYFSLIQRGRADAPAATAWITSLQAMILEDGDSMDVHSSDDPIEWISLVHISTREHNFTDDVKLVIVPQMCNPACNLGPCWQEIDRQEFNALLIEIATLKEEQARKEEARRRASDALARRNAMSRNPQAHMPQMAREAYWRTRGD